MAKNRFHYYIRCMYIACFFCLASCSDRREYVNALNHAERIIDDNPDSALIILDGLIVQQQNSDTHYMMQCRLHRLNALNKLDTLFLSTDEPQTLADYFDRHGTSNEQMLAYYLLGRAYYDTHEAPMALSCFQKAVESADTIVDDCNYRLLSRVYGQKAALFYHQNLMENALNNADLSIRYAFIGRDTINAIMSMSGKINIFYDLSMIDSAISVGESASELALSHGYRALSAAILGGVIGKLVEKGEINKARQYIDRYESESGYFDSDHHIEEGKETYYYVKGLYYLATNHLDSAEHLFRRELTDGEDFNNQNAGARGLALLYQKKQIPDSAAKYALYSYAMNDSLYAQMAMNKVEQMQALYDYSRHQEIAQAERDKREKAEKENETIVNICVLLLILVVAALYFFRQERNKRKREHQKYDDSVSRLAKAQVELNKLRSHQEEYAVLLSQTEEEVEQLRTQEMDLNQIIADKEREVARLNADVESYKEKIKTQKVNVEAAFEESDIYQHLKKKAAKAEVISDEEWQDIYAMTIKLLPNFYKLISSNKHKLNDKEFKTCILIRLLFIPKEIAYMVGLSQPSITKIRNNMMKKLFDEEGKSKELDERLKDYS